MMLYGAPNPRPDYVTKLSLWQKKPRISKDLLDCTQSWPTNNKKKSQ